MHAKSPAHPKLLDFITIIIFEKTANYEAHNYAVFSSLQLIPPSYIQIFSSVLQIRNKLRNTLFFTYLQNISPIKSI
jgi:hypothetical protein